VTGFGSQHVALLMLLGLAACAGARQPATDCPAPAVIIDIGHTAVAPGATAASGATEHSYNHRFAALLAKTLQNQGRTIHTVEITGPDPRLDRRVEEIRSITYGITHSLVLSVHHDSVQERYLKSRLVDGVERLYTDTATGFSLFVPAETAVAGDSLAAARSIADRLIAAGERPSRHHAEPIEGENRRLLDQERGIYAGDFLKILRTAEAPIVLLEIGVIKNPADEQRLSDPSTATAVAEAIAGGATLPCRVTSPSAARIPG
jgi:N-acetylmuramoyl-L-alanine amidase